MRIDPKTVVGGVLAFAFLLTVLQSLGLAPSAAAAGTSLSSWAVDGPLPVTEPDSALWADAVPLALPLSAQIMITPTQKNPTVDAIEVRSLNNGTHIAFRIRWADATKDAYTTTTQQFRDAVAIQVGAQSDAPYLCMGGANARMNILQWKADWQADIEEGFHDLQDEFPNFWVDYYPYAIGGPPYEVPAQFPENASLYLVGYSVGNPFSQPLKVTPVEDALAYGFFTITTGVRQDALGWGEWRDGAWTVVIARALDTGDPQDNAIGRNNALAFAVWDGGNEDRGSRKSTTGWVPLGVQAVRSTAVDPLVVTAIILIAVPIVVLVLRRLEARNEPMRIPEERKEPGKP